MTDINAASPQPPTPSSAEVAREIVKRFAAEVRREGFKGAMYAAVESLMDEFDGRGDDPAIDGLCQLMSPLLTPFITTAALRGTERQREVDAQIAESHTFDSDAHKTHAGLCTKAIAAAIRNSLNPTKER